MRKERALLKGLKLFLCQVGKEKVCVCLRGSVANLINGA